MNARSLSLCCIFFVLVFGADGVRKSLLLRKPSISNYFDVLVFTQRWAPTACFVWKQASKAHTCTLPKDEDWTIHGIWPSEYHKLSPQYCNKSLPFNVKDLQPVRKELNEKWIDIENGHDFSFWRHEWEKHGTCAMSLKTFDTELKYFGEGLSLHREYDMKDVLAKANILPGSQYAVGNIFSGVEKILGKRGQIICARDSVTDKSYLMEVRICFNKTLELTHCDNVFGGQSNCHPSQLVIYPSNVPGGIRAWRI